MPVQKKNSEIKCAILLTALQPPFKSGSCPSQIHIFIRTLWTAEQGPHIGKRREQQNAHIFNTWHRGCFMSFSVFGRCVYTVFSFISTEQGKVLKVLHTSEGVFIISQYSMFHNEGPVLNMAIDSQKVRGVRIGVVEGDVSCMLQH